MSCWSHFTRFTLPTHHCVCMCVCTCYNCDAAPEDPSVVANFRERGDGFCKGKTESPVLCEELATLYLDSTHVGGERFRRGVHSKSYTHAPRSVSVFENHSVPSASSP